MKIYSIHEILNDIETHEDVKIQFDSDFMQYYGKLWYLKLYSEEHPSPFSDSIKPNEQIRDRSISFIQNQRWAIPGFDISPTEAYLESPDACVLVYRLLDFKHSGLPESRLEFVRALKEKKEVSELFSSESDEISLCFIVPDEKEASYFVRNIN